MSYLLFDVDFDNHLKHTEKICTGQSKKQLSKEWEKF